MDNHGAQLRGAYGDDLTKDGAPVSNPCEDNEEPVVDQFHSDGTLENKLYEAQFQQPCSADYTTNQGEDSDDLSGEIDERMLNTQDEATTENSNTRLEGPSMSPEDHNVEPIAVFDGSGHETRSYVSSDLEGSHSLQGASIAESGGRKELRTGDAENLTTKTSLAQNVADTESGTSQSVKQSAIEDSKAFDRLRTGNSKPTMQRRGSRGRRKRMPSLSSDSPPVAFFPEEVAPVAATILTNPKVFTDPGKKSASNLDDANHLEESSKLPSHKPRLKAFGQKLMVGGNPQKLQSKGETLLHF